ncbi:MAG: hypothetical protein AAGC70_17505 [Pseudomonadota bacterium]
MQKRSPHAYAASALPLILTWDAENKLSSLSVGASEHQYTYEASSRALSLATFDHQWGKCNFQR